MCSAVNESGSASVDLMAVCMIVSCLCFLKFNIAGLYKEWILDFVELSIYMNIIILSLVKLYILSADEENTHKILAYISVSITLVLFVIYHLLPHIR